MPVGAAAGSGDAGYGPRRAAGGSASRTATCGAMVGVNLISVAVARDIRQAMPDLGRLYILTLQRAGKEYPGRAVETEHVEIAVLEAPVRLIKLGERTGLVGLDGGDAFREQRPGIGGSPGLLRAGGAAGTEHSNQWYQR